MSVRAEKTHKIPSEVEQVAPTVDRIVAEIRDTMCIAGRESDFEIALMEAVANAVIHGNRQEPAKQVCIFWRHEPRKHVSIVVRDEGAGFDVSAVPDPTRPENLAAEHGRGILLMRTFMDEVHFEKGGTEVHLLKKCGCSA
jgi:serine/threonine-protein kinase RsbW